MIKRLYFLSIVLTLSMLGIQSCDDFVQVDLPNTKLSTADVFGSDETAVAAVLGMYDVMQDISAFGAAGQMSSVTALAGLSADELVNYSAAHQEFIENNIQVSNTSVLSLWATLYNTIYVANSVIEGASTSSKLSKPVRDQLEGEGKFMRAFCHFYLVNLFGDVPLVTTTDYRINSDVARTSVAEIYDQMILDLTEAGDLLPETYPSVNRARPNKYAAKALLARTYLYNREWEKAEQSATEVIVKSDIYILEPELTNIFVTTSKEAIWQLASTAFSRNTWEGRSFILVFAPFFTSLNPQIMSSFESGDKRQTQWVGTYVEGADEYLFPYKYKIRTANPKNEHSAILRLAEVYLIRSEARAQLNKLTGSESAAEDLNFIRLRAGLLATTAEDKEQLLNAILEERRLELFTEWGHRWFDLKRTGQVQEILGPIKPGLSVGDELYPIPEIEMSKAPNLRPQNPGTKKMKIKSVLLILALSWFGLSAYGRAIEYPEVNKPCPNFRIQLHGPPKREVTINDFKGKPLIIEFWNKYCSACITALPKASEMQKKFKDQLTIIVVGHQDQEGRVQIMYEKLKERFGLDLLVSFDSSLYFKAVPIGVPHLLWINKDGIVQAITNAEELNTENVKLFTSHRTFDFVDRSAAANVASARKFDRQRPFLTDGNGGNDTDFTFRSLLAIYRPGMSNAGVVQSITSASNAGGVQGCAPLNELYLLAYAGYSSWSDEHSVYYEFYPKLLFDIADTSEFTFSYKGAKNLFWYSQVVPLDKATPDYLMKVMQNDLSNYFGYRVVIEVREVPVWRLTATADAKSTLRTKKGDSSQDKVEHTGLKLTNVPMKHAVHNIFHKHIIGNIPIIDDTGIQGNIDIELDAYLDDMDNIKAKLSEQGLILKKSTMNMKAVVIQDIE